MTAIAEFQLFARLKKSSRYYGQGLGQDNKPMTFAVEAMWSQGSTQESHPIRFNNNRYPREDVELLVLGGDNKLHKL